jgi:hypothetical protein
MLGRKRNRTGGATWSLLDVLERICSVALLALPSVTTFVNVVLGVTTRALLRYLGTTFNRLCMARLAGYLLMLAFERKPRTSIMVIRPSLPTLRVMA